MLRLNPVGYYRLVQATQFESSYAGGEANVAVSLANYGMSAAFVTKVPEHEVGQCAVNAMRQFGVDTTYMHRGGSRLGVYYAEKASALRRCSSAVPKRLLSVAAEWEKMGMTVCSLARASITGKTLEKVQKEPHIANPTRSFLTQGHLVLLKCSRLRPG